MMSLSSVTLIILLVQNLFNPQKQLNKAKTKKDYDEMKQMLQQELAHYWGSNTFEPPKKIQLYNRNDELQSTLYLDTGPSNNL